MYFIITPCPAGVAHDADRSRHVIGACCARSRSACPLRACVTLRLSGRGVMTPAGRVSTTPLARKLKGRNVGGFLLGTELPAPPHGTYSLPEGLRNVASSAGPGSPGRGGALPACRSFAFTRMVMLWMLLPGPTVHCRLRRQAQTAAPWCRNHLCEDADAPCRWPAHGAVACVTVVKLVQTRGMASSLRCCPRQSARWRSCTRFS